MQRFETGKRFMSDSTLVLNIPYVEKSIALLRGENYHVDDDKKMSKNCTVHK